MNKYEEIPCIDLDPHKEVKPCGHWEKQLVDERWDGSEFVRSFLCPCGTIVHEFYSFAGVIEE